MTGVGLNLCIIRDIPWLQDLHQWSVDPETVASRLSDDPIDLAEKSFG